MLATTELPNINKRLITNNQYKETDMRTMQKISSLTNFNDYDYYLMACALCNYDLPEKKDLIDLRMSLFKKIKDADITTFKHKESDYNISKISLKTVCKNTGNVNKYGLYEYEINSKNTSLIQDLWSYKDKNCLKYVDSKTYDDKIIISIRKEQLENFMKMLDILIIGYDKNDLLNKVTYKNSSTNSLIDLSKLSLPFEPYDYQIEDANKIIKMKRALLGHEMGCISGDALVTINDNSNIQTIKLSDLFIKYQSNNTIMIESYNNGDSIVFMPIKNVLYKGKKSVVHLNMSINSVKCTYDHEILTDHGWIAAENLSIGDIIISKDKNNNITKEQLISINKLSIEEDVYDVVINDLNIHNFIPNNIVVHNCGKTFISILIGGSIGTNKEVLHDSTDELDYDDIVITDKGPLPIGKIVEENIDCKVKAYKNGKVEYVNILSKNRIED